MKYAVLIYERPGSVDGFTDTERAAISAEYYKIREDPGWSAAAICIQRRLRPPSGSTTTPC
ncbi:hypothetical protein [Microlunatus sp. Gsoil 973]|uniref:hypothetical protein n=1 Tax=Microlunatus sp. Gsoil 973 TaxID=2672569 RepID=UPI001E414B8D|nr:hypothetical protein [Microlunatus sp. Gsoil 973]